MYGVLLNGPVTGSFKDIHYNTLIVKTKNPDDLEASARLIDQLAPITGSGGHD